MSISLVAIGDEVLYGYQTNTNARFIAAELVKRGISPSGHIVVSDDPQKIAEALEQELKLGKDVIATGGLGPTIDDHTKAVVAALFGRPLIHYPDVFHELQERFGKGYPTIEEQSRQPEGAIILKNRVGTAPGLLLEDEFLFPNARLFLLPGPPQEMQDVFLNEALPRILITKEPPPFHIFRLLGVKEHEIDLFLRDLLKKWPGLKIGIYPSTGFVSVHLSSSDGNQPFEKAKALCESYFGEYLLPDEDDSIEASIHRMLREKGWKIATAESCTAGGLSNRLASLPGSSDVFAGGVVAYMNGVKENVLHVSRETLNTHSAVSVEVTEEMALGVEDIFHSDVSCAISGYLGPGGGTATNPVGTVCITVRTPSFVHSEKYSFSGPRQDILQKTVQSALIEIILALRQESSGK